MTAQSSTEGHTAGVRSRAAIAGHPMHPITVTFPIAFLSAAPLADLVWWATVDDFWARVAVWLVGAGLLTGVLAALVGLVDFLLVPRTRTHADGWIHFLGNDVALILAAVNWWIRLGDQTGAILPWGLTLSVVTAGVLALTGWYGGELAYRHMIGVTGHSHEEG